MRLRFSSGDRVGALRAYTTCREVLAEELELEPDPETVALANWMRGTTPVRLAPTRPLGPLDPRAVQRIHLASATVSGSGSSSSSWASTSQQVV